LQRATIFPVFQSAIVNRKSAIPLICSRMKTILSSRQAWEVAMRFQKTLTLPMLAMGLVFALPAWAQQKLFTRDQVHGLVRDGRILLE
jgi:C4-dicarboxylate transporter